MTGAPAPVRDHIAVRLADEGVPVAAIARAAKRPAEEIWELLRRAMASGQLAILPAADWPPGTRREMREPALPPLRLTEMQGLALKLQARFGLARAESRALALLMCRQEVLRTSLHVAISGDDAVTVPKTVDVHICRLRQKLARHGVDILTICGRGYRLPAASKQIIVQLVQVPA